MVFLPTIADIEERLKSFGYKLERVREPRIDQQGLADRIKQLATEEYKELERRADEQKSKIQPGKESIDSRLSALQHEIQELAPVGTITIDMVTGWEEGESYPNLAQYKRIKATLREIKISGEDEAVLAKEEAQLDEDYNNANRVTSKEHSTLKFTTALRKIIRKRKQNARLTDQDFADYVDSVSTNMDEQDKAKAAELADQAKLLIAEKEALQAAIEKLSSITPKDYYMVEGGNGIKRTIPRDEDGSLQFTLKHLELIEQGMIPSNDLYALITKILHSIEPLAKTENDDLKNKYDELIRAATNQVSKLMTRGVLEHDPFNGRHQAPAAATAAVVKAPAVAERPAPMPKPVEKPALRQTIDIVLTPHKSIVTTESEVQLHGPAVPITPPAPPVTPAAPAAEKPDAPGHRHITAAPADSNLTADTTTTAMPVIANAPAEETPADESLPDGVVYVPPPAPDTWKGYIKAPADPVAQLKDATRKYARAYAEFFHQAGEDNAPLSDDNKEENAATRNGARTSLARERLGLSSPNDEKLLVTELHPANLAPFSDGVTRILRAHKKALIPCAERLDETRKELYDAIYMESAEAQATKAIGITMINTMIAGNANALDNPGKFNSHKKVFAIQLPEYGVTTPETFEAVLHGIPPEKKGNKFDPEQFCKAVAKQLHLALAKHPVPEIPEFVEQFNATRADAQEIKDRAMQKVSEQIAEANKEWKALQDKLKAAKELQSYILLTQQSPDEKDNPETIQRIKELQALANGEEPVDRVEHNTRRQQSSNHRFTKHRRY